jgi:thiamine-phosphate pyrophosphorylase
MGGIKARHIPDLIRAGAKHIAMVTEITAAPDIEAKVRELRALFRQA